MTIDFADDLAFANACILGDGPAQRDFVARFGSLIEAALARHRVQPCDRADVRQALLRDFETSSKQNAFLVSQLSQRYQSGEAPESVWQMPALYKTLTPESIRDAARASLDANNYVKVVLRPQAGK